MKPRIVKARPDPAKRCRTCGADIGKTDYLEASLCSECWARETEDPKTAPDIPASSSPID